jgi:tRNA (guanine37-N1)-methyltransferase
VQIDVISIFPDYLAPLRLSLVGKAIDKGLLDLRVHDLREETDDVHRTVDDSPYGGGPGMVMKPEPWGRTLDRLEGPTAAPRLIVPTPAGRPFTQALAEELSSEPWLAFACGRYEGIDHRVIERASQTMVVDQVSLGDYVLAGGEVAALVVVEAVARLLPGVLGNAESHQDDSFSHGLLEAPAYTRPASWAGLDVPAVLLSGDHKVIDRWRRDVSLRRTAITRPELLEQVPGGLSERDRQALVDPGPDGVAT